jgi:hypothetical protein
MKYSYTIDIYLLDESQARPHTTLSGTVEAERYSTACQQAWQRIHAECETIRRETGKQTAAGHFIVNPER